MNNNRHRYNLSNFKMIGLATKQIIGIIAVSVLVIGVGVGVYLVQRQQTIKSGAAGGPGSFVSAFELKDKDGHTILCDTSKNPPECTTRTLDINVRVKDLNPLLP